MPHSLIVDKKPLVIENSPIMEFEDGRIHFVCGLFASLQQPPSEAAAAWNLAPLMGATGPLQTPSSNPLYVFLPEILSSQLSHWQGCQALVVNRVGMKQTAAVVAGVAAEGRMLQVSQAVLDVFGLGTKESTHIFEVNVFPNVPAKVGDTQYILF